MCHYYTLFHQESPIEIKHLFFKGVLAKRQQKKYNNTYIQNQTSIMHMFQEYSFYTLTRAP